MYQLTDEQVTYILNDIRRNGVEMEDLQLNLLDHVCCIIEQNLEEGGNFQSFYQQTISRFYNTGLKEIEEETINLLTFKNYYVMKRSMIISGASAAFLLLTGSFFKFMHWPGAAVLLVLGIVFFSMIFLPILLAMKAKELKTGTEKLILGIGTFSGILYCLASLFKVQHWPGANVMLFSTLGIILFVLLPLYFFNGIRKPETKLNTIITSIILVGVFSVQFLMVSLKKPYPDAQASAKQSSSITTVTTLPAPVHK